MKWTFEMVKQMTDSVYEGYIQGEYGEKVTATMISATLISAGWSDDEYDEEVIMRNEQGCQR